MKLECCPQCGGDPFPLGCLGIVLHLRCRQCGWTYQALIETVTDDEEGE